MSPGSLGVLIFKIRQSLGIVPDMLWKASKKNRIFTPIGLPQKPDKKASKFIFRFFSVLCLCPRANSKIVCQRFLFLMGDSNFFEAGKRGFFI